MLVMSSKPRLARQTLKPRCSEQKFDPMTDQQKTSEPAAAPGLSEAERMAKIRELLVGPAIADESERIDRSVDRLHDLVKEQQEALTALRTQVQELEDDQRRGIRQLRLRLLGIVESLIADEEDVRSRIMRHDILMSELENEQENKDS